jgi:hypothetical protein
MTEGEKMEGGGGRGSMDEGRGKVRKKKEGKRGYL